MDNQSLLAAPPPPALAPQARQGLERTQAFLTFTLGSESYGVDILQVQEIRSWTPITSVPNTPPHVLGVLNLRGTVVPVVDLRRRFSLASAEYTALTVVVVVAVHIHDRLRTIGLVVDGVSDVLEITPEQIQPAPDFGAVVDTDFIRGLAQQGEQMVMLLELPHLIDSDELFQLTRADDTP